MPQTPQPTPPPPYDDEDALRALLHWYEDMGMDEVVSATPVDFYENFSAEALPTTTRPATTRSNNSTKANPKNAPSPTITPNASKSSSSKPSTGVLRPDANALSPNQAIAEATRLAAESSDIAALEQALRGFNGCTLKKGARNTVFADGIAGAPLLVMGEAPGADEDRDGKPFVGRAGLLLDKMLGSIGHDRATNSYISNVIYWRPPGNRTPSPEEILICRPFAERLIELAQPKAVLISGAVPLKALMDKSGIMKHRGQWQKITTRNNFECPVLPTFHPAYLLRNPETKRLVWHDLQKLAVRLKD